MDDANSLQLIIQGGAIGITILLIAYLAWRDKIFNETLQSHFDQDAEAKRQLASAIQSVGEHLATAGANHSNLSNTIERNTAAFNKNAEAFQRIEGILHNNRP